MGSAKDRRRRIRVPVQRTIRHSRYQVLGTPVFEENSALDLSSGGVSFEAAQDYKIGSLVLLEVEVEGEIVKILVCVAWTKPMGGTPPRFQLGGELIAIDPVHRRKLQAHLGKLIDGIADLKKAKKKKLAKKSAKKVTKKAAKKSTSKKKLKKKPAKKSRKKSK